jgi:hypothetical protein
LEIQGEEFSIHYAYKTRFDGTDWNCVFGIVKNTEMFKAKSFKERETDRQTDRDFTSIFRGE